MDYGFYNPFNGFSMQPNGFQFQPMNRYQSTPQMPPQATQSGPDWIMAPSVKLAIALINYPPKKLRQKSELALDIRTKVYYT